MILQTTVGFSEAAMIVERKHPSQRKRFAVRNLPRCWKLDHDSAHLLFAGTGDFLYHFQYFLQRAELRKMLAAHRAAHYSVVHLYLELEESFFPCCIWQTPKTSGTALT